MPEPARLRADAERNRRCLLAAAAAAFAEGGLEVGVADIARRAGVGTGTLFRRFPTKADLVVAVVEACVGEVIAAAEAGLADPDPWHGLVTTLETAAELQSRNRGLLDAAGDRLMADPRLRELHERVVAAIGALVARAQAAAVLRDDVTALDVAFLLRAVGQASWKRDAPELWRRCLGILLDGLRPAAATQLAPGPRGPEILQRVLPRRACPAA